MRESCKRNRRWSVLVGACLALLFYWCAAKGPAGLSIADQPDLQRVIIVFGAYLPTGEQDLWQFVLEFYLEALVKSGLAAKAQLVHVCLNSMSATELHLGSAFVRSIIPRAIVTANLGNEFEYRGVWQAWQYGVSYHNAGQGESTSVLYYHSKGMTHGGYMDLLSQ
jgi:hypothetical protein